MLQLAANKKYSTIHTLNAQFSYQQSSNGHNLVKTCPKEAYEVFLDIYIFFRCQKTSHMQHLDDFELGYGHLKAPNEEML